MSEDKKRVKIKATVYWCFHNKMNEMAGKYTVDLCNLSEGAVAALEDMGISVQSNDKHPEKGMFITCKSQNPIKVYDTDGDELMEEIGNESKARAIVSAYPWTYKNKKGISPSLGKLVITDLVEYAGGAGGDINENEAL
jgi:hypothetical protein